MGENIVRFYAADMLENAVNESRPRIEVSPDFGRFRDVLLLKRVVKRPPLFDFHVAPAHKAAVLGRACESALDQIEFFRRAGYDYVQMTIGVPRDELDAAVAQEQRREATASHGKVRVIESLSQFRSRRWSWFGAAEGDLSLRADRLEVLSQTAEKLPAGMKILIHTADVFTIAWEMIGFDEFCLASVEEPELIEAVMGSLGRAAVNIVRRAVEVAGDRIGAFLFSDDIAYTEGLMLSPAFYRRQLFPVMREMAAVAGSVGAPMIYHSDGRLFDVFDDLAGLGVRGNSAAGAQEHGSAGDQASVAGEVLPAGEY